MPSTLHQPRHERRGRTAEHLITRYCRTGDRLCRADAIEAYMPLARRLARHYYPGPEPFDDLLQVAYMGLVKAVDRFDPDAGTRFSSFAIPTITGELRRHFRDTTWSLHLPRGLQEDVLRTRAATTDLTERLARAPTVSELSAATGLSTEQIAEALQAQSAKQAASLDQPVATDGEDGDATLADLLGDEDDGFDLAEHRTTIAPLLRALPRRDREMLYMRFAQDMTQSEIAAHLDCSQMHISRMLRRTLDQLATARTALPTITSDAGSDHVR
ncbi:SigB/SigF/SigG family RNA polymerase sigma factor [Conexibacter sp. CPCC 206217]|uniref:SigB/SigF/SigG family RNA polymerase sigma factor n=1 Tax=Conexibacter sp. CPCC 206217 TaxID=3064574 RepID=UPI00272238AD|nr:SigB/SigF/SigG family RNA polymerase sigma factor [Conexibacter sp. CPCC 206217]MDO8208851.1 SigB/SigF/SigG family RNA polymerase sigma factor [Conexibacter sp. CPCC 206217]